MKNLFVLFSLILSLESICQTFEKTINFAQINRPYNLIETTDGFVVSVGLYSDGHSEIKQSNLIVLNKSGEIVINKEFRDYYMQTLTDLWNINDSTIGVLGYASVHPDSMLKIIYYQLDSELNIVSQTDYTTEIILDSYIITDICQNQENHTVYQLSFFYNNHEKKGMYFMEFSKQGDIIKENYINTNNNPSKSCITSNNDSSYLVFLWGMKYELSKDLIIKDTFYFEQYFQIVDVIWENDSTLIMSVPHNYENGYYYMGISRTRNGKEVLEEKYYDWNELYEMYPYYNSFDTVGNYFYLAATTNFSGGSIWDNTDTTGIRIIKANKDFSVKWDKTYRRDANSYMYTMIGTSDGGCLIAGSRYDFTLPEQRQDLYILKVDSLGNYLSDVIEDVITENSSVHVYPNPGTETLNFAFPDNWHEAKVNLYTISGKNVMKTSLTSTQNQINTSAIPNGIYIWEVIVEGAAIERGKWIKQ
jgi:hypothetical protein